MNRTLLRTSAVALLLALTIAGCSSKQPAGGSSGPTTKVKFMVSNPVINLGHTHLAVAVQKGYFKQNNVDVELLTSQGTVATVQALATGTADMGQLDTMSIDTAVSQGVTDLVAVCSYVSNNIYNLAVLDSSATKSVADLKGKKIVVSGLGTGVFYNAMAMVQASGLDPKKDVEFVTIAQPGAQLDALVKGDVAALSIIDTSVATFQNKGTKLRTFAATGPMQWQWNVVGVRKSFLNDHRDAVAGVCKAMQASEVYVAASPQAALKQYKAWGGDMGTTKDDEAVRIIDYRAKAGFKAYSEGNSRWGWINVDQMDGLAKVYSDLGVTKSYVAVKSFYSNDLIDRIQPDEKKVRAEAGGDAK